LAAQAVEISGAHVEESHLGDVELFVLGGEFDAYSAPALEKQLCDAIERGEFELVLDMNGVTFIDMSTLHVVHRAMKEVYRHNGHLAVATTSRPVLRAIELAGMKLSVRIFPTRQEAVAAEPSDRRPRN
jgi:anti-sigma B factor antagonist